ncbi:MAG: hypothetical protein HY851_07535 [candidate division Zixibacteria bacterium]|nr:hypothetical protein [candidate division Zixibacteria bacterium]
MSVSIGHDLSLNLPPGWMVISDTLALPVHLACDPLNTQMSVFRSEFSGSDRVGSQEELKKSVQKVIDEVILTLPDARLLTSSGFDRGDQAGFVLEFTSTDTTALLPLRHRFEGLLYRLPDDRQVLFTLWAKAPVDYFALADSSIRAVQASFEYTGPKEAAVFGSHLNAYIIFAALVLIATGLIYYGRSRKYAKSVDEARRTASSPQAESPANH